MAASRPPKITKSSALQILRKLSTVGFSSSTAVYVNRVIVNVPTPEYYIDKLDFQGSELADSIANTFNDLFYATKDMNQIPIVDMNELTKDSANIEQLLQRRQYFGPVSLPDIKKLNTFIINMHASIQKVLLATSIDIFITQKNGRRRFDVQNYVYERFPLIDPLNDLNIIKSVNENISTLGHFVAAMERFDEDRLKSFASWAFRVNPISMKETLEEYKGFLTEYTEVGKLMQAQGILPDSQDYPFIHSFTKYSDGIIEAFTRYLEIEKGFSENRNKMNDIINKYLEIIGKYLSERVSWLADLSKEVDDSLFVPRDLDLVEYKEDISPKDVKAPLEILKVIRNKSNAYNVIENSKLTFQMVGGDWIVNEYKKTKFPNRAQRESQIYIWHDEFDAQQDDSEDDIEPIDFAPCNKRFKSA